MDSASLLERLRAQKFYDGQITHVEEIPSRPPRFAEIRISARIVGILRQAGIPRLYSHQARAIELVRAGRDVVVVTGTASGKTLCWDARSERLLPPTQVSGSTTGEYDPPARPCIGSAFMCSRSIRPSPGSGLKRWTEP